MSIEDGLQAAHSMNPVHMLGPAVAAGNYTVIWVYLLAPSVGALAGAGTLVKLQIGEEVELLLAEVWALLLVREQALLLALLLCHFSYALTYKVRDKFTKDILYDKQYQLCLKEIQTEGWRGFLTRC